MSKLPIFSLCLSAVLFNACTKPDPVEYTPSDFVLTFNYSFGPGYYGPPSLTSDKIFKMKVLEYGSDQPLPGTVLKFGARDCSSCDSLKSDVNGDIVITGKDVGEAKCTLRNNGYWTHGSLDISIYSLQQVSRVDSVFRGATVDSVVTRMYPLSWLKVHFTTDGSYPSGSYTRPYVYNLDNAGKDLRSWELTNFSPNKDTVLKMAVFGNANVKIGVSVRNQASDQIKFVYSEVNKAVKGDTTLLTVKL